MTTKEKKSIKMGYSTYSDEKPAKCEASVNSCTECPYESCLFDFGNRRMLKRNERGTYKKHGNTI
jgi:hypothetical protein